MAGTFAVSLTSVEPVQGVDDDVAFMEGVTPQLAVKFGEEGIKSVEDVAGLVPDDLIGWKEPGPDNKPRWQPGLLEKGEMSREDAELFILKARVAVGWVEPEALEEELAKRAAALDAAEAELEGSEEVEPAAANPADQLFNIRSQDGEQGSDNP